MTSTPDHVPAARHNNQTDPLDYSSGRVACRAETEAPGAAIHFKVAGPGATAIFRSLI